MAARTALPAPHPPPLAETMKTFIVSTAAFSIDAAEVSSAKATETPPIEITANTASIEFTFISWLGCSHSEITSKNSAYMTLFFHLYPELSTEIGTIIDAKRTEELN